VRLRMMEEEIFKYVRVLYDDTDHMVFACPNKCEQAMQVTDTRTEITGRTNLTEIFLKCTKCGYIGHRKFYWDGDCAFYSRFDDGVQRIAPKNGKE
jgi:hypothetical protein